MVKNYDGFKTICLNLAYNGLGFRVEVRKNTICIFCEIKNIEFDCDWIDDMLDTLSERDQIRFYDFDGAEYFIELNRF